YRSCCHHNSSAGFFPGPLGQTHQQREDVQVLFAAPPSSVPLDQRSKVLSSDKFSSFSFSNKTLSLPKDLTPLPLSTAGTLIDPPSPISLPTVVELPTVLASPMTPLQEGAGLADVVDLDPHMSSLSLTPTADSATSSVLSVPESVPKVAPVFPTLSESKISRLRR